MTPRDVARMRVHGFILDNGCQFPPRQVERMIQVITLVVELIRANNRVDTRKVERHVRSDANEL